MFKWAVIKEASMFYLKIKMLKQVNYNQKYIIDVGETMEERIIFLNQREREREREKDFGFIDKIRSMLSIKKTECRTYGRRKNP